MTEAGQNMTMSEAELLREEARQLLFAPKQTPAQRQEGLQKMIDASNAGDPEAMYFVGKLILEGKLKPKNENPVEHAVRLLCRAAKGGCFRARSQLLWYRRLRYREVKARTRAADGPLTGFDGKEIHISRTGRLTPVDAVLTYENGLNTLSLSLNLNFVEDEKSIPDVEMLHRAVISGIMSWAGEYTVFGGQRLKVDIHITTELRLYDNVSVVVCSGEIGKILENSLKMMPTQSAKDARQVIFRENRAAAAGRKKWSVRTRKIICLQTRNGCFDNEEEIMLITRHEFGHVLGLGDLYAEPKRGLEGVPAGTWAELDAYLVNGRDYNLVMCNNTGLITGNDIEMVVLAFSKNRPQAYQPDRYIKIVSEALGKGN